MANKAFDVKKEYKDLYLPKSEPMLIEVPVMKFICIDGEGDPNGNPAFERAVEALYALSYTIKMSYKNGNEPTGFFEYVVPPLEGLWWVEGQAFDFYERSGWKWTLMIRQMDFVDNAFFSWAIEMVKKKKPEVDVSAVRFETFTEGLCVQAMHIGPFADEPETVDRMKEFMEKHSLRDETGIVRKHHEIYMSDFRKANPETMKTVLRHPVRR